MSRAYVQRFTISKKSYQAPQSKKGGHFTESFHFHDLASNKAPNQMGLGDLMRDSNPELVSTVANPSESRTMLRYAPWLRAQALYEK
jgi:hypothetical protein